MTAVASIAPRPTRAEASSGHEAPADDQFEAVFADVAGRGETRAVETRREEAAAEDHSDEAPVMHRRRHHLSAHADIGDGMPRARRDHETQDEAVSVAAIPAEAKPAATLPMSPAPAEPAPAEEGDAAAAAAPLAATDPEKRAPGAVADPPRGWAVRPNRDRTEALSPQGTRSDSAAKITPPRPAEPDAPDNGADARTASVDPKPANANPGALAAAEVGTGIADDAVSPPWLPVDQPRPPMARSQQDGRIRFSDPRLTVTEQRTHFASPVTPTPASPAAPTDDPPSDEGAAVEEGTRDVLRSGTRAATVRVESNAAATAGPVGSDTVPIAMVASPMTPTPVAVVAFVADAIAKAADDPRQAAGVAAANAAQPTAQALAPVREIALNLDLGALGGLTVRMTITGQSLTVRLTAEHDEAVHALHRDRAALEHILERAGYDADIVTVGMRAPDPAASAPGPTAAFDAGVASGDPSGRGGENRPRPQPRSHSEAGDGGDPAGPSDRTVRGLYV